MGESADKPGSVVDSHSSRRCVTTALKQPTRIQRGPRHWIPIWSCSEWGLPCHALLPGARCALTAPFHPYRPQRFISGALAVYSLLHFPSAHAAQALPGTLPYGARTFLPQHLLRGISGDCLANSGGKHTSALGWPQCSPLIACKRAYQTCLRPPSIRAAIAAPCFTPTPSANSASSKASADIS